MKFKKDGKVFGDIAKVADAFCEEHDCFWNSCPLDTVTYGEACCNWIDDHPTEAARLMGYEVVEEEKEANMDKQNTDRPCKWCQDEFCTNGDSPMRADFCPVPDTPGVCRHEDRARNFTAEEVEDARQILRLFGGLLDRIQREESGLLIADRSNYPLFGPIVSLAPGFFPSLQNGETVMLKDIAEG